jgi:hypothetical protein
VPGPGAEPGATRESGERNDQSWAGEPGSAAPQERPDRKHERSRHEQDDGTALYSVLVSQREPAR